MLVIVAIIFNCLISTFKVAFYSMATSTWVIAYLCDFICFANIIISFFVTRINRDDGIFVTSCSTIGRSYFRELFIFDVITVFPTDLFIFALNLPPSVDHRWKMIAALRTNRLAGLRRVFKFIGSLYNIT